MERYFVHKEAVLDKDKSLVGYELFFRKASSTHLNLRWPLTTVDAEVIEAVSEAGGFERLIGNRQAFVSINPELLEAGEIDSLPKGTVLQISEKDGLDKDVYINSALLKKRSYSISIEHTSSGPGFMPFHQIADFVRTDALSFHNDQIASTVSLFKKLPLKLMVANVNDKQTFVYYKALGFDVFEGAFFTQPVRNASESISSSQTLLIQLSNDLRANKELSLIEKTFRNSPKLTYGLLKLINSAFFGVSQKISSIRHAIALLGYENLQKWVSLLLFTIDMRDGQSNPLIEKAVVRARVMELLAKRIGDKSFSDTAFITGMFSFVSVLFNVGSNEVTEKLNLAPEIQDALVNREGPLGILLNLAEKMDRQDYEAMDKELEDLKLVIQDVLSAETGAVLECQTVLAGGGSAG
ncbi:MAG: HDOD domain protein [Syntrophorhabdaceae bacterium PtaU1.Bin034]|jgi:EAL and modified HD-GYP domain-containing signal transduction protein|nr:MAG: HDOD domain protein [Syntrophorhabdaceae bacterium PtaU1.Bin034]